MDEPEPTALAQTVPEFAVPSPAIQTPLDAGKKFTFEDEFEQRLSVTPKSVTRTGLPEATPPRPRDSLSSPLAKQQRLLQPAQSQPSTSAKRQVTVPQKTVTSPARQTTTSDAQKICTFGAPSPQPPIRSSVKRFSFTSPSPPAQQKTTKRLTGFDSSPSTSMAQQQTQRTPPKTVPDIDWDLIRQSTGVDYLGILNNIFILNTLNYFLLQTIYMDVANIQWMEAVAWNGNCATHIEWGGNTLRSKTLRTGSESENLKLED